jgi:hypothetical protein
VPRQTLDLGGPPQPPHYDYYKDAVRYATDKHTSQWQRLLGDAYVDKPSEGAYCKLSDLLQPAQLPEPTTFHLDLWGKCPCCAYFVD